MEEKGRGRGRGGKGRERERGGRSEKGERGEREGGGRGGEDREREIGGGLCQVLRYTLLLSRGYRFMDTPHFYGVKEMLTLRHTSM
eukprot:scaffold13928_cov29-Tisochrysis_lutea.AAC.3